MYLNVLLIIALYSLNKIKVSDFENSPKATGEGNWCILLTIHILASGQSI